MLLCRPRLNCSALDSNSIGVIKNGAIIQLITKKINVLIIGYLVNSFLTPASRASLTSGQKNSIQQVILVVNANKIYNSINPIQDYRVYRAHEHQAESLLGLPF